MNSITSSSKNNLIQNFYIIGFSPEDFFKTNKAGNVGEYADIFKEQIEDIPSIKPKIITKYPDNKKNINSISDEVIIDHCFTDGMIKAFKKPLDGYSKKYFQFELDNIPQNYPNDEQKIYSKIYFTCLEFGESISDYYKFRREIFNTTANVINIVNYDKNEIGGVDIEKKYSNFLIPKVICFASVMPFFNELSILLDCIYNYHLSKELFPPFGMENIIGQIVTRIPIPLKTDYQLGLEFKTSAFAQKLTFPLCYISELHINSSANMPLVNIFRYFSPEDIIRIFKYILFEIPILIFSNDKLILSLFVDTFLSILSPFKYVYPHISMLPKKLYGLINLEHFIFGINEIYTDDFFYNNKINLDKTVIIVNVIVDEIKKTAIVKFEEKIFEINKNEYILGLDKKEPADYININGNKTFILGVDIPNIFKKKLLEGMNKFISFHKRKNFFSNKDNKNVKDITIKTQYTFFAFFVNIMSGYTDYLLKPPSFYSNPKNIGENIYFKDDYYFLKEVFNSDEFIIKAQKDCQTFYSIFFRTKMFLNFLRERIYNDNALEQIIIKQFDILTVLKKHHDLRKKSQYKTLYENFKSELLPEKKKNTTAENIILLDDIPSANNDLIIFVNNNEINIQILTKYIQLFSIEKSNKVPLFKDTQNTPDGKIQVRYYLFPRLLFDYSYIKKSDLAFYNNSNVEEFKLNCRQEYEKIQIDIFDKYTLEKMIIATNDKISYQVTQNIYIKYIWLILLSCSLWYCEPEEKNHRLDKLFEILYEINYFEKYVLNIVFINIYKYGGKYYLIKLYLLYKEIIGYTNYYFNYLLCDKIKQQEADDINDNEIKEEEEEQNELQLRKRYLIKLDDEFSKKRRRKLDVTSDDNEEIIFSSEQTCEECKEISDVNIKELLGEKKDLNIDNYPFICPKCKKENKFIIIKYQILLYNCVKKEVFVTKKGDFQFLSPYKLYRNLKNYLIEEYNDKLEVNDLASIEDKICLKNILFFFFLSNLSFDFLLPYVPSLSSTNSLDLNDFQEENANQPIKLKFKNKAFRQFNYITPLLNLKKKASFSILGIGFNKKAVQTDLSFTIKGKKKGKK